jgi:hypothetical protein
LGDGGHRDQRPGGASRRASWSNTKQLPANSALYTSARQAASRHRPPVRHVDVDVPQVVVPGPADAHDRGQGSRHAKITGGNGAGGLQHRPGDSTT